jgi:hypothetical protein
MKLSRTQDPESTITDIISNSNLISTSISTIISSINSIIENLNDFYTIYKNSCWGNLTNNVFQRSNWYQSDIERIDHMSITQQAKNRTVRNNDVTQKNTLDNWLNSVFYTLNSSALNTTTDAQALIDYWNKELTLFSNWNKSFNALNTINQPDKIDLDQLDKCQADWNNNVYVDFINQ